MQIPEAVPVVCGVRRMRHVAFMLTIVAERGRSVLIEDAALVLGVSRRTVYYRIRDGRLETVRTRGGSQRVLLTSIERLLQEGRQQVSAHVDD